MADEKTREQYKEFCLTTIGKKMAPNKIPGSRLRIDSKIDDKCDELINSGTKFKKSFFSGITANKDGREYKLDTDVNY
jgi:hypothetical protein